MELGLGPWLSDPKAFALCTLSTRLVPLGPGGAPARVGKAAAFGRLASTLAKPAFVSPTGPNLCYLFSQLCNFLLPLCSKPLPLHSCLAQEAPRCQNFLSLEAGVPENREPHPPARPGPPLALGAGCSPHHPQWELVRGSLGPKGER